jgi:hypothetical protein
MLLRQKIFAIIVSVVLLAMIIELVRRKKLREEYSFLWILTGVVIIILVVWYDILVWLSRIIGAIAPTSTLFVFAILFIMMILMHFSIKISELAEQIKILVQEVSILRAELEKKNK